ncbi:hypothetical protein V2J09_016419 [Rumex salicifolius]
MAKTRNPSHDQSTSTTNQPDPINTNLPPTPPTAVPPDLAHQMTLIASRLDVLDSLASKVASLEAQSSLRETSHRNGMQGTGRTRGPTLDRNRPPWWEEFEHDEEGYRPYQHPRRPRAKIDFPRFEGGDPRGWVLKADKYFRYFEVADDMKVEVAAMHLDGDALDLYAWVNGEGHILGWDDLVRVFQEHYGPPDFQNPDEFLCSVRQTGTIAEYRLEFARRAARVVDWSENALLGVFIAGMREELKSEVRIHKPRSVYKAASLALEYESKLAHQNPQKPTNSYSRPTTHYSQNPRPSFQTHTNPSRHPPNTSPAPNPQHITVAERQLRRERGLCFRCGEKFTPDHQCVSSFSQLEFVDGNGVPDPGDDGEEVPEVDDGRVEISFHQISGANPTSTLQLRGTINGRSVLMLVDSGSTHNFISSTLADELQLPRQDVPFFGVTIGNGEVINCGQICPDVTIRLPGVIIRQDFFPFDMGTAELVVYRAGKENNGADALSRRPHSAELFVLAVPRAKEF